MISTLLDWCPRYSGTFIYGFLILAKLQNNLPEIHYFVNNSGRSFLHYGKMSKTSKIKELVISDSLGQCPRYLGTFIYTLLALDGI